MLVIAPKIFIIEKAWVDQMENRNAYGYAVIGYKLTEEEAKQFCESGGFYTNEDCWQISKNQKLPKFRYEKLEIIE
jgi:hypothetical protein